MVLEKQRRLSRALHELILAIPGIDAVSQAMKA
jgi:hypothetical protein